MLTLEFFASKEQRFVSYRALLSASRYPCVALSKLTPLRHKLLLVGAELHCHARRSP